MSDFNEKIDELKNTKDSTSEFDQNDITQNKGMTILAYLSWLVLIPLFAAKESKFARFHCNQGIVLAIAEAIIWVTFGILSCIPYVGWIFSIINSLLSVVCVVFAVLGIVNVAKGKAKELPIVGKFKILK
ncbi:MAG: zinc ribbon domain-containing protein [Clostridia bacterium]|nr:zinc ribbon domain-containing protein [Clostridia bacterium]